MQTQLLPLLQAARNSEALAVLHIPNGHSVPPGSPCAPIEGEHVVGSNDEFDRLITQLELNTLFYVGYAANRDMLFGVGGKEVRHLHSQLSPDKRQMRYLNRCPILRGNLINQAEPNFIWYTANGVPTDFLKQSSLESVACKSSGEA